MINGWLTLLALRDGKIVKMFGKTRDYNRTFKMEYDEDDEDKEILVEKCGKEWTPAVINFNTLFEGNCMVIEDYDLTFEEAIREMLDGKIVSAEYMPNRIFKFDKKFFWASRHDVDPCWNGCATLSTTEQEGMWRVVE